MSSKRNLKKDLNYMVIDIVEECFTVQIFDETKTEATDAIIEEAAIFQDTVLSKINAAKNKSDFKSIREEIENSAVSFVEKLNGLH